MTSILARLITLSHLARTCFEHPWRLGIRLSYGPSEHVRGRRSVLAVGLAAFIGAAPAFAAEPVTLRPNALGHGGVVTLGDLFEGAEGAAAAKVVGRAPIGQQAVLDAGDVQLAAHAAGLDWANGAGQRQIIVTVLASAAGASERNVRHVRHVSRAQSVLVYARSLSMGEIIEASDLQWSDEAVAGPDTPDRAETVIGMAARLPLRAGAPVSTHELVAPKVIRRDQMISVDYIGDGVSLSLSAKAMGDAAVGDTVQVMNLSSKKTIEAVASAPGHAAVGPGADAVRGSVDFRTAAN